MRTESRPKKKMPSKVTDEDLREARAEAERRIAARTHDEARSAFAQAIEAADQALAKMYSSIPDLTEESLQRAKSVMFFIRQSLHIDLPVFDAPEDNAIMAARREENARALLHEARLAIPPNSPRLSSNQSLASNGRPPSVPSTTRAISSERLKSRHPHPPTRSPPHDLHHQPLGSRSASPGMADAKPGDQGRRHRRHARGHHLLLGRRQDRGGELDRRQVARTRPEPVTTAAGSDPTRGASRDRPRRAGPGRCR